MKPAGSRSALRREAARLLAGPSFVLAVSTSAHADSLYSVTRLDPLSSGFGNYSTGLAINDAGIVVGEGPGPFTTDLMLIWRPGNPTPEPVYFEAFNGTRAGDINDSGDYVGHALVTGDSVIPVKVRGFLNGADLGFGVASGINNFGQIVGTQYDQAYTIWTGYIYDNGTFHLLPNPGCLFPQAINDHGVAVGWQDNNCQGSSTRDAVQIRNDSVLVLGNLGGPWSEATDINDSGVIVGWSYLDPAGDEIRGFIWRNGAWTVIPTFGGGGDVSQAQGINDSGVVVGFAEFGTGPFDIWAFIYDAQNGLRNLNDLIPPGTGWVLQTAYDINQFGDIVGHGLHNGVRRAFLLRRAPDRFFALEDKIGVPIAFLPVTVSLVANDAPLYSETVLVVDTTDADGRIPMPRELLVPGTPFSLRTTVHEEPAVKGDALLENLYSIRLDNVQFDSAGAVQFDTTTADSVHTVVLDHATVAINLVISIEWDADLAYLESLQAGLRLASNYFFDVTDGQAHLDTVYIYDAQQEWGASDVRIYSSTEQWPQAAVADRARGRGAYSRTPGTSIELPRMFYINHPVGNREADWVLYPYDWTVAQVSYDHDGGGPAAPYMVEYCPTRTLMHELGHYLFGFRDEYVDSLGNRVDPGFNLGMMDDQLIPGDAQSSELSTAWHYAGAAARQSKHWQFRMMSCWDWLEQDLGDLHGGVRCEIVRPDEIHPPSVMRDGPNNDVQQLDYDIGSRAVFPIAHGMPFALTKPALVMGSGVNFPFPVANANVNLIRPVGGNTGTQIIQQGLTSHDGFIRIVGIQPGDELRSSSGWVVAPPGRGRLSAASASDYVWFSGEPTSGLGVDTIVFEHRAVEGDYPMILRVINTAAHSFEFSARTSTQLPGSMSLRFLDEDGTRHVASPQVNDPVLVAPFDSLGQGGHFDFMAEDQAGYSFFIPGTFAKELILAGSRNEASSAEGDARLDLDSIASETLATVSFLSTPYPVVRTGLDGSNVAVSRAHALTWWPAGSGTGPLRLSIRYEPAELDPTTEASIRLFAWDTLGLTWSEHGGLLDTSANEVHASIVYGGVYALFTDPVPTGTGDGSTGGITPHGFELLGNHPNPFNAQTAIEYVLPHATQVRIEIFSILGQRVRLLVDATQPAGHHRQIWNAQTDDGRPLASGVYLYRIQAGGQTLSKKMLLLR